MANNRMTGLLRVANDIATRSSVDRNISGVPSTGAAQALSGVSAEFDKIGARIGQMADKAAAVEGAEAGRMAGLDPEFRTKRDGTIRGDAYDQAGLDVAGAQFKQQIDADFEKTYTDLAGNPAELEKVLAGKAGVYIRQAPEELRPGLELLMRGKSLGFMREIAREQVKQRVAEQNAALQSEASEGLKRTHQLAYRAGLDEDAGQVIAAERSMYLQGLNRTGVDGKPLMTPAQKLQLTQQFDESVTTARVLGAYDRLPGIAAKEKFIADFEDDFANSRGLAKVYDLSAFQGISAQLRNGLTREKTESAVALRALREEAKSVVDVLESGASVPPDQVASIEARVAATGGATPELAEDVAKARSLLNLQNQIRMQPPAAVDAMAETMRADIEKNGATPERVSALSFVEKYATKARTELKQDPLTWADRTGRIKLGALDFTNAETAGATMKARIAQAEEIASAYSIEPVYLRPDETRALSIAAAQGGEQMLAIAGSLAAASGDRAPKVIAEISKDAPVVAFLAGHVNLAGVTSAARDAADGIALSKVEGFKSLAPSKQNARSAAVRVLGDALASSPRDEAAVISASNAIYEVRARRQGVTDFDEELWSEGLREALGERRIGGEIYGGIAYQGGTVSRLMWPDWSSQHPIVLPPSVRQDALDDVLEMLDAGDLDRTGHARPVGATGAPIAVSRIREGTLVQIGAGRYAIAMGDPSTVGQERWLKINAAGDPFVLDLAALAPVLGRRRPDLILGGR